MMTQAIRILKVYRDELNRDICVQEKSLKEYPFDLLSDIIKRRISRNRKYLLEINDAIKLLNEAKSRSDSEGK